jgi:hypothetical protein
MCSPATNEKKLSKEEEHVQRLRKGCNLGATLPQERTVQHTSRRPTYVEGEEYDDVLEESDLCAYRRVPNC